VIICSILLVVSYSLFLRIFSCFLRLILSQSTDVAASAITSLPKTNCMGAYSCVCWYVVANRWDIFVKWVVVFWVNICVFEDEYLQTVCQNLMYSFQYRVRLRVSLLVSSSSSVFINVRIKQCAYWQHYYYSSSSSTVIVVRIKQCAYWQHCYYSSTSYCGCQSHILHSSSKTPLNSLPLSFPSSFGLG